MTHIRTFRIAVLAVLAVSALVLIAFILRSPAPRVFDIDPSIATITITAKRLSDTENAQASHAAREKVPHATPATAKNPPASDGTQSGAFVHGVIMPTQG